MDVQAEFQSLIDRYLVGYESNDAIACTAQYAPSARILSPWGPPATGHAAIKALHEEWFLEGETDKVMKVLEAQASGDIGFCLVRYAATVPSEPNGSQRIFGTSLNTLIRQPEGPWKIQHTSINALENEETGFEQ